MMTMRQHKAGEYECYPSEKWIRCYFNGRAIVDSKRAVLLRTEERPPVYYFPKDDVMMDYLRETSITTVTDKKKSMRYWDLRIGERTVKKAAMEHLDCKDVPSLTDCLNFDWFSMDNWFEEDEEIFTHPRDPRVRIDALQSSRHIKVIVEGEAIAETRNPVLLFETGLPIRYYIPKTDLRHDLLVDSDRITYCPYKGEARYYSIKVGKKLFENAAWYYRYPVLESLKIASHVAFYDERIDGFEVDGKRIHGPEGM